MYAGVKTRAKNSMLKNLAGSDGLDAQLAIVALTLQDILVTAHIAEEKLFLNRVLLFRWSMWRPRRKRPRRFSRPWKHPRSRCIRCGMGGGFVHTGGTVVIAATVPSVAEKRCTENISGTKKVFTRSAPAAAAKWIWRAKQMTEKAKLKLIEKIIGEHFEMGGSDESVALVELLNCILTIIDFKEEENAAY